MAIYLEFNDVMFKNIIGVSYVGKPKNNTIMYLSKKIESKLLLLSSIKDSVIFIEKGINIPNNIKKNNIIIISNNPVNSYTNAVASFYERILQNNRKRQINISDKGYFIGENVKLGKNVNIEPGAFIDHDVEILDNVYIKSGAKIRYGTIVGRNSIIGENVVIGESAFNTTKDDKGILIMVPCFGKVVIGNNVYIGANTVVGRGGADDTIIGDNVKIDSSVKIGHDVYLHNGVEVIGASIIAGYCEIGRNTVIAANATIKNRLFIGENCYIGMGSVVHHNVKSGLTVSGNPAKSMEQIGRKMYFDIQLKELVRMYEKRLTIKSQDIN